MFHDHTQLEQLRAALWRPGRTGGAAVMIGAGLSMNAIAKDAHTLSFPSWRTLVRVLVDTLYQELEEEQRNEAHERWLEQAYRESDGTAGFLRIAEEFAVYLGRPALRALLERQIEDIAYEPSELHDRLVSLPWSDIFTTNWDTLIERSARRCVSGHYSVIHQPSDLPTHPAPRIVKLHGTFGIPGDLVFGEEDFRRYPRERAPFVNLVRQSMMEKAFCLIGFSGSDPNFLHWAGWVRDQLGTGRHHIYLCGLLDLSPSRRRFLEHLNIIPIDLSPVVSSTVPDSRRHQVATDWLLTTLEQGKPFHLNFWPEPRGLPKSPRSVGRNDECAILPLRARGLGTLTKEAEPSVDHGSEEVSATTRREDLAGALQSWERNRHHYPGWLVLPMANREVLWRTTHFWLRAGAWRIPENASDGPWIGDRRDDPHAQPLKILSQLAWRCTVSLRPMPAPFVKVATEVIEVASGSAGGRLARQELLLTLLRHHRSSGDVAQFNKVLKTIKSAVVTHKRSPDVWASLCFEQCLLALSLGNYKRAAHILRDWPTVATDRFWRTRRAAVLAELGRIEESFREACSSLNDIRASTRGPAPSIALLSREGWTMLLVRRLCDELLHQLQYNKFMGWRPPEGEIKSLMDEIEERCEELAAMRCNAEAELQAADGAMRADTDPLGRALQCIALLDTVGLPVSCGAMDVAATLMLDAASRIEQTERTERIDYFHAVRLVLRVAPSLSEFRFRKICSSPASLQFDVNQLVNVVSYVTCALYQALDHGLRAAENGRADYERRIAVERSLARFRIAVCLLESLLPVLVQAAARAPEKLHRPGVVKTLFYASARTARAAYTQPAVVADEMNVALVERLINVIMKYVPLCAGTAVLKLADCPIPGADLLGRGVEQLPEPLRAAEARDFTGIQAPRWGRVQRIVDRLNYLESNNDRKAGERAAKRRELLQKIFPPPPS